MSQRLCCCMQHRWLSWISLYISPQLSGTEWALEDEAKQGGWWSWGQCQHNCRIALLWSGFLQVKDHLLFLIHTNKQAGMPCFPLFLGQPQDKEPYPNSVVSAGYKEMRVRPAVWRKGDFALCFPCLLGFPGLTVPWGSGGSFCSCKCCLRHKVLARDWKYFDFWLSKSALNLIPFKRSFACWVRNLFKLQYFSLSNYWRGSKLIFSFIFTVQNFFSIYKDCFGLMFWRILKVVIMWKN